MTHPIPGRARVNESYRGLYCCQSPYCVRCEEKKRYTGPIKKNKLKISLLQDLIEKETGVRPKVAVITLTPPKNQCVWWKMLGFAPIRGRKRSEEDRNSWSKLTRIVSMSHWRDFARYPSSKNPQGGAYKQIMREFARKKKGWKNVWDTEHVLWNNAMRELLKLARNAVKNAIRIELELEKGAKLATIESYDPMSAHGIYHHVHVVLVCAYLDADGSWRIFEPSEVRVKSLGTEWKKEATRAVFGPLGSRAITEHVATSNPSKLDLRSDNDTSPIPCVAPVWLGNHAHVRVSELESAVNYALKSPLTMFFKRFLEGKVNVPKFPRGSRLGMALNAYHRFVSLARPRPRMITASGILSPRSFLSVAKDLARVNYPSLSAEMNDWETLSLGIKQAEEALLLEWWEYEKGKGSSSAGAPSIGESSNEITQNELGLDCLFDETM